MFLASDCCPQPLADGLHELSGLSCASPSMEHSYSNICYLAVAAHLGADIGANHYLTGLGCKVWLLGNRYRLVVGIEGCYMHTLCPQEVRQSALFLSSSAWQRVARLLSTVLLWKDCRAGTARGFAESSQFSSATETVHSVWMT